MLYKNILLVDDDPIYNLLHKRILEHTQLVANIHIVTSGMHAIEFLNTFYSQHHALPEIVLLDLDMPVMDGFRFLELMRAMDFPDTEPVKVILITSSSDPRDMTRAKAMGIKNYLVKPVALDKLRQVLLSDDL